MLWLAVPSVKIPAGRLFVELKMALEAVIQDPFVADMMVE